MRSWAPWFVRMVAERRYPWLMLFKEHDPGASFHNQIWPGELGDADPLMVPIEWGVETKPVH